MPICITCSTPVKHLYTTYSKADDRSLGKGVRLTQCPNCKRFADKYVEHDYIVLFIDLVLIKPQVYRHLLFNRLYTPTNALDPSILRLGILLILFDVYITWARIERSNSNTNIRSSSSRQPTSISSFLFSTTGSTHLSTAPIITQYLFFLTLNIVATIVQHGVVRILARWLVKPKDVAGGAIGAVTPKPPQTQHQHQHHQRSNSTPFKLRAGSPKTTHSSGMSLSASTTALDKAASKAQTSASTTALPPSLQVSSQTQSQLQIHVEPSSPPDPKTLLATPNQTQPGGQASPSAVSTALLVSSCTKLFPILLVIWPTGTGGDAVEESSGLAPFAHRATSYIGWIVLLNNIEALLVLLDCGYGLATMLALAGVMCRWVVEGWMLGMVGLVREVEGPVADAIALCAWVLGGG